MAKEIERRFLLNGGAWREGASGRLYRQGYVGGLRARRQPL